MPEKEKLSPELQKEYQYMVNQLDEFKKSVFAKFGAMENFFEEKYGIISQHRQEESRKDSIQSLYSKAKLKDDDFVSVGLERELVDRDTKESVDKLFYKGKIVYKGNFVAELVDNNQKFRGYILYNFIDDEIALVAIDHGSGIHLNQFDKEPVTDMDSFTEALEKHRTKIITNDPEKQKKEEE